MQATLDLESIWLIDKLDTIPYPIYNVITTGLCSIEPNIEERSQLDGVKLFSHRIEL